jgi:hypothetical protein
VSATCDGGVSDGWQQSNSRVSVSSTAGTSAGSAGLSAKSASSRRARAESDRHISMRRRDAAVISQPFGLTGTPSRGHCVAAASNASCTASSHVCQSP